MDDFLDEPAATPAAKSAVEPQVDLFADADFQSATPGAETTAHQDVQVWFSSSLCIEAAKYVITLSDTVPETASIVLCYSYKIM